MRIKTKIYFQNGNLFFFIFFATFLLRYFSNYLQNLFSVMWAALGTVGLLLFEHYNPEYRKIFFNYLFIDAVALVGIVINQSHSIVCVFFLICGQLLGLLWYKHKTALGGIITLVSICSFYIIFYIINVPKVLVNAYLGQYAEQFSTLVGGNTVSIFLILFLSIGLIDCYYKGEHLNYLLFIVSIIIAAWCGGTGGVLSLSIFFVGVILLNWKENKVSYMRLLLILIIGFTVLFLYRHQRELIISLLDDNSRFWMWNQYYHCATNSVEDFIFGGTVEAVPFLVQQKNCHNTFINFHFYYGIIPFAFYIWNCAKSMFSSAKNKNYLLLLIMVVTVVRAMTDDTIFGFVPIWTYISLETSANFNIDSSKLKKPLSKENARVLQRMDNLNK